MTKRTIKNDKLKLKNYSETDSFDRLSDPDIQSASAVTAGGDASYIAQDLNDKLKSKQNDTFDKDLK
jgi:hypothetical protein